MLPSNPKKQAMLTEKIIREAVARMVAIAHPSKVIMFGSYARNEAKDDSDLDLMVIEQHVENAGEEMVRLRNAVGHIGIGVDVLVYSDEEAARRSVIPGTLLYWAHKEGR
ncbi:MAG: DNA polymerase subunit beta, partial [Betaproteobacteria bacterium RBG_16_56_24]